MKKLSILGIALLFSLTSCSGLLPSFDEDSGNNNNNSQEPSNPSNPGGGSNTNGDNQVSKSEWEYYFNAQSMLMGNYQFSFNQNSSSFQSSGDVYFDSGKIKSSIRSSSSVQTIDMYYQLTQANSSFYNGYVYNYNSIKGAYDTSEINGSSVYLLSNLGLLVFSYSNFSYDSTIKGYVANNLQQSTGNTSSNVLNIQHAEIYFQNKQLKSLTFTYYANGSSSRELYTYVGTLSNYGTTHVELPSTTPTVVIPTDSEVTSSEWALRFMPSYIVKDNLTIKTTIGSRTAIMNFDNQKVRVSGNYDGYEWEWYVDIQNIVNDVIYGVEYDINNNTGEYEAMNITDLTTTNLLYNINFYKFSYYDFTYNSSTGVYHADEFMMKTSSDGSYSLFQDMNVTFENRKPILITGIIANKEYRIELYNYGSTHVELPDVEAPQELLGQQITSSRWNTLFKYRFIYRENLEIIMNHHRLYNSCEPEDYTYKLTADYGKLQFDGGDDTRYFNIKSYTTSNVTIEEYVRHEGGYAINTYDEIPLDFLYQFYLLAFDYNNFTWDEESHSYVVNDGITYDYNVGSPITSLSVSFVNNNFYNLKMTISYTIGYDEMEFSFRNYGEASVTLPEATVQPVEEWHQYYLVGGFNNWMINDNYKLTHDTDNEHHYYSETTFFEATTNFKVSDENGVWYGCASTYEGCGYTFAGDGYLSIIEKGYYVVHFYDNPENGNYIVLEQVDAPDDPNPEEPTIEYYAFIGGRQVSLSLTSDIPEGATAQYIGYTPVSEGNNIEFRYNGSYLNAYPASDDTAGENYNNYFISYNGDYFIQTTTAESSIYLTIYQDGSISFWISGGTSADHTAPKIINNLSVDTTNVKIRYLVGEDLDITGLVVYANYTDGSVETIPLGKYTVSFDSLDTVGEKQVTISYNGYSTIFNVYVIEPQTEPDYYLTGTMNSWSINHSDYKLTQDTENTSHYYIDNIYIDVNDSFKVVGLLSDGTTNYYSNESTWEGCGFEFDLDYNLKVLETGTYHIDFYIESESNNHIVLSRTDLPQEAEVTYRLVGAFCNWDNDSGLLFTKDPNEVNHYYIESVYLIYNEGIKVVEYNGEYTWYGNSITYEGCGYTIDETGIVYPSLTGTYRIDFYVTPDNGVHIVLTSLD